MQLRLNKSLKFVMFSVIALFMLVSVAAITLEAYGYGNRYYAGQRESAANSDRSIFAYYLANGNNQSTIHQVLLRRRWHPIRHIAFSAYSLSDNPSTSMRLVWLDANHLQVICKHCDDFIQYGKQDHWDNVSLSYLEEKEDGLHPLIIRYSVR